MITDDFIFVHIPKTGGTTIRHVIQERKWKRLIPDIHLTLEQSIAKVGYRLPSFCFIRNPWDWYVSRFFYRLKVSSTDKSGFMPLELMSPDKDGFTQHILALNAKLKESQEMNSPCRAMRFVRLQDFYDRFSNGGIDHIGSNLLLAEKFIIDIYQ